MCLSDSAKILVKAKKKHPKQQPKKKKKHTTTNKQVNCLRWRINKLYLISNKKSQLPHTFSLPLHLGGQVVLSAAEGDKQGFMDELTAEQICCHPAFCITSYLLGWFLPEEAENILLIVTQIEAEQDAAPNTRSRCTLSWGPAL